MTQRVLHPDVYDALELSALVFDGIGKNVYFNAEDLDAVIRGEGTPCCVLGHAQFLDGRDELSGGWGEVARALGTGAIIGANDAAVNGDDRISFEEWCKRMDVVRGEDVTFDAEFVASLLVQ